ncbi:potassium voltage-gated channel unc-103, partial [Caerostris darwini]
GTGIDLPRSTN